MIRWKTLEEEAALRREECDRIAFVHVRVFNDRGNERRKVQTVCVEKDRITSIQPRGEALIPATNRVVLGLGRFLVPITSESEDSFDEDDFIVETLARMFLSMKSEVKGSSSSDTAGNTQSRMRGLGIVEGGAARLVLLKRDPRRVMISVRDIAGLMIDGIYYSEMQLNEWVDV